jgi:hypothetical protein
MDRRWSIRKPLYLGVTLEIPSCNQAAAATLLDISLGGALLETQILLPSNAVLTMLLKLPGKSVRNYFSLKARMVHRTLRGAGLAFVDMPTGLSNALSEALFQYEQQLELSGFAATGS